MDGFYPQFGEEFIAMCAKGRSTLLHCPRGMVLDPELLECMHKDDYKHPRRRHKVGSRLGFFLLLFLFCSCLLWLLVPFICHTGYYPETSGADAVDGVSGHGAYGGFYNISETYMRKLESPLDYYPSEFFFSSVF